MNHARRDEEWLNTNRRPAPPAYDSINPSHYHGDRKFEPIDVIEDWGLDYHLGNALKYIARNGRKPGEDPREGISKAIWYLERYQDKNSRPMDLTRTREQIKSMVEMTFESDAGIPDTILFGTDDEVYPTPNYEEITDALRMFHEWDDDEPYKDLADH